MAMLAFWLQNRKARIAFLVGSPIVILVLLACAGIRTLPVFKLKVGRVKYKIAAQNNTSNANNNM
jgi:hypothetical protein